MKFNAFASALIAFACGAVSAEAAEAVTVNEKSILYDVAGQTLAELAKSIKAERPSDVGRFIGQTTFYFTWDYDFTRGRDAAGKFVCTISGTAVVIDIVTTLPHYPGVAAAPQQVRSFWKAFSPALVKHEAHHARDFIAIGSKIPAALDGLSAANCNAAQIQANKRGMDLVQEAQQSADDYDARTNHGANEGADFPGF